VEGIRGFVFPARLAPDHETPSCGVAGSRRDVKIGRHPETGVADARARHFGLRSFLEREAAPAELRRQATATPRQRAAAGGRSTFKPLHPVSTRCVQQIRRLRDRQLGTVVEKFMTMRTADMKRPTTDTCELALPRVTQRETEQRRRLAQMRLEPARPPLPACLAGGSFAHCPTPP